MARAEYAAAQAPPSPTDRVAWRAELSALTDQGRFFVPNAKRAEYGQHKIDGKKRNITSDHAD